MLSSITPLGQRSRGMSWGRSVAGFWIGALGAGVVVFGLVGELGEVAGIAKVGIAPSLVALALALLLDLSPLKPPGPLRQVDEDWLGRYRDWVVGVGFGAQLGAGFATIIPTWGTWALVIVAANAGLPGALLIGATFGVGRSVLLIASRRSVSTVALAESMRRFVSAESRSRWISLAGYAVALVAGGVYVT